MRIEISQAWDKRGGPTRTDEAAAVTVRVEVRQEVMRADPTLAACLHGVTLRICVRGQTILSGPVLLFGDEEQRDRDVRQLVAGHLRAAGVGAGAFQPIGLLCMQIAEDVANGPAGDFSTWKGGDQW